jgi:hypothetical protein
MSVADFHSALAEPIHHFVDYKQALNRKYRPEAAALRLFDRYLGEHVTSGWDSIDSILIEPFLQSRPRVRAATTICSAYSIAFSTGPSCKVSSRAIPCTLRHDVTQVSAFLIFSISTTPSVCWK